MVLIADTGPPGHGETARDSMPALQQTVPPFFFKFIIRLIPTI